MSPCEEKGYSIVGPMIDFENGDLDQQETIELFTHLIRTGIIFHLQGSYQRLAQDLVSAGLVDVS